MPKRSKTASRQSTPSKGRADLARLRRTGESEIAKTSPRELRALSDSLWDEVRVVTPSEKQAISIRLDRDIVDYFRSVGPRYQSQINAVLRSYVEHATANSPRRRKRAV